MEAKELFEKIGHDIDGSELSQMFGKPCFKVGGKAYVCFFQEEMVFKLSGQDHTNAINLSGSKLFDPSGKNRPMKEWVQVSFDHSKEWIGFARQAYDYVSGK